MTLFLHFVGVKSPDLAELSKYRTFRSLPSRINRTIISAEERRAFFGTLRDSNRVILRSNYRNMLEDTMNLLHNTIEETEDSASGVPSSEDTILVSASEEETKLFWAIEMPWRMSA